MNKMNKLKLKLSLPNIKCKNISNSCDIPKPPFSPLTENNVEFSKILDNIYISNFKTTVDYKFLLANKITHIINCAGESRTITPIYYDDFKYYKISLKDEVESSLSSSILQFIKIMKEITQDPNNKILIHCVEGISRAPALVASYLIWKYNYDAKSAIEFIKEKRKCVDINIGFIFQLENIQTHREIFNGL